MSGLAARIVVRRPSFTLEVDVAAQPGEVLAVLGPNGAGKSTLLGVLAGLLRPDDGTVRLGDRIVTGDGVHVPPHRRGVGLLAQQAMLFPHLTALANVAFGPRAQGVARQEAEERARELLAAVDVAELADRRPAQMSGGQQQRVALARALAPGPELLLLDEPLAALDVDSAPAMRSLLRRVVKDRKQTAVLVTHSALDALVLADRVVVLTGGSVVESGPAREVLARPRSPFTARIAGLDLVPGEACADGLRTADGLVVAGLSAGLRDGESAVAVFPPSAVAVYNSRPEGSPRNVVPVRLAAIEPHGDVVRLRAAAVAGGPAWVDGLAADVTPAAVADLGAEPGVELWFAVKATEVQVHAAG
ncbi:sulfate/molybdate ABC transporter ATP-binding protein [Pseudonocardia sp. TRM90224]|uniref:sulfate/molybdate ABC transporter ATP-binding protein n=1 Tax=Pseudonocardia sp. TRM90224 TaxID=2812678 RepID=UPI001E594C34|nr:ATP-binding cassette domain-containing protein [Pseudonocardia sp. TRM90224]